MAIRNPMFWSDKTILLSLLPTFGIVQARLVALDQPGLAPGVQLKDGSSPLRVDNAAAPCVVDWNGDGKKDLTVGQQAKGNIRLYLNRGSDAQPLFDGFTMIMAGGVPISVSCG